MSNFKAFASIVSQIEEEIYPEAISQHEFGNITFTITDNEITNVEILACEPTDSRTSEAEILKLIKLLTAKWVDMPNGVVEINFKGGEAVEYDVWIFDTNVVRERKTC